MKKINYSVVRRIDPRNPHGEHKFYAHSQARGITTVKEMSRIIQKRCTVTRTDVVAVLTSLEDVIRESLESGYIVSLGDLGSFRLGFSSEGTENEEDFTSDKINKVRVIFSPGRELKFEASCLDFEKVDKKYVE